MKTKLKIAKCFALILSLSAAATSGWCDEVLKTAPGAELVPSVPITISGKDAVQVLNFCIPLQKNGKTADVRMQLQLSNSQGFNVGIEYSIKVTDMQQNKVLNSYDLTLPAMMNITPSMRHTTITASGIEQISAREDANHRCYSLMIKAAAENAQPGNAITVESGYGQVTVALR